MSDLLNQFWELAEASTMIVCTDIVVTNIIASVRSLTRSGHKIRQSVAIYE